MTRNQKIILASSQIIISIILILGIISYLNINKENNQTSQAELSEIIMGKKINPFNQVKTIGLFPSIILMLSSFIMASSISYLIISKGGNINVFDDKNQKIIYVLLFIISSLWLALGYIFLATTIYNT